MSDMIDTLSVVILVSSFILMANKRIKSYIKTIRLQSLLIAILIGLLGMKSLLEEKRIDVLIICLLVIAVKVIFIPNLLSKMVANVEYKVEKDFIFNIPALIIVCCGLVVLVYFSISNIDALQKGTILLRIVNSISVILIGLFFMISRKKAIGQIIGFLEIENGLFISALFLTEGMPFIIDMGILVDLLSGVMVMGIMVFKINEKFDSIDIDKLNNLRG